MASKQVAAMVLIYLLSMLVLTVSAGGGGGDGLGVIKSPRQLGSEVKQEEREQREAGGAIFELSGRRLGGVGSTDSTPPTCISKCGRCYPCKVVLVPIHTGVSTQPLEYYPEEWRCQCGNHLFMP